MWKTVANYLLMLLKQKKEMSHIMTSRTSALGITNFRELNFGNHLYQQKDGETDRHYRTKFICIVSMAMGI